MRCPTPRPNWCARVKAISDIPGRRRARGAFARAGRADRRLRRRRHRRIGAGVGVERGHPRRAGIDRRVGRRSATEDYSVTTSVLAFIPSPDQGVWHLGPVPLRAYALCIIAGIVAALIIGDRRWVGSRRQRRRHLRHRAVGGAVRLDRRPALSRHDRLADVLRRRRRGIRCGPSNLGRRPRHLGRGGPRRRRRVDRLPQPRHPAARLRRRDRARHRVGAGHRPPRQLLQPGTLRAARRLCRGVWRSTSGATPPGCSTRSTACRPASSSTSSIRRSCTNCCGTCWFSRC